MPVPSFRILPKNRRKNLDRRGKNKYDNFYPHIAFETGVQALGGGRYQTKRLKDVTRITVFRASFCTKAV